MKTDTRFIEQMLCTCSSHCFFFQASILDIHFTKSNRNHFKENQQWKQVKLSETRREGEPGT